MSNFYSSKNPEVNKVYTGKVISVVKFGAFIEILPGKQGLCHISNLSNRRVNRVEDVLSEGEEVDVKVIGIDKSSGKIQLSIKDISESNIESVQDTGEALEVNKVYTGRVVNVVKFGAFIEILHGKQGLCHISNLSDRRVNRVEDVLSEGEEVDVKVIGIDKSSGKIQLSIKDV